MSTDPLKVPQGAADLAQTGIARATQPASREAEEGKIMKKRADATSMLLRVRDRLRDDDGAATAEYAVATMAAVGFAGLLVVILRGDEVRGILTDLVRRALSVSV
jgi:Flp pilus assembly pilin Flp